MGAVAVTRVSATGPIREGNRIVGATLQDHVGGSALEARAACVLDATGVWNAQPDRPFGAAEFSVLPSRGSHLVIPRDRLPAHGGMTLRIPGRVAFIVPWPRNWIIGTTDKPYHDQVDRPAASGLEVDEILGTLNGAMNLGLTRSDVIGTYAGLRPLIAPSDASSTVKVSRGHKISVEGEGLVRVSGGKYTTYRAMAEHAVDAVLGAGARSRPSRTADLPITGAAARSDLDALASRFIRDGLDIDTSHSLVDRHGIEATEVLDLARARDMARPLLEGFPYLEAEVAWAVEQELALSLDDILARRIRLAPEVPDRGASIAPRVAQIAGAILGWDDERRAVEIATYLEGAHREYDVPPAA
jgi:glycerol-3-phosphate dehydrogenase